MKTKISDGRCITVPAPHDVDTGDGVQINAMFGVACHAAAKGGDVTLDLQGCFSLPKAAPEAHEVGQALYWNADKRWVTLRHGAKAVMIGKTASSASKGDERVVILIG